MNTRRHVLALLAATPFAAPGCAPSNLPDPVAAWREPGAGEADTRRHALAHAILAPNPHNRQPWLVELIDADELMLFVDLERLLPATDPFDRQIVLGCGAFLELFDLAARANGQRTEIVLWPDGEPQPRLDQRPVARIKLAADATTRDPLFDHLLTRRTNRKPFEDRSVSDETMSAMANAALAPFAQADTPPMRIDWTRSAEQLAAARSLAWSGFALECATPAAYQESVDLMRIGQAEIAQHRDGIALEGPMVEFAKAVGLLNRRMLADTSNSFTRDGINAWRPLAENAPAYAWMVSRENTRTAQIEAGRAYARFNLAATARGVAMHPWSMALQEYPEMAELYAQAKRITGAGESETTQMLVRVGYGRAINPAPRRGFSEHLRA